MLTTEQLRALIADRESDRVELTVSTNNTDKFGEAICAFANDFSNHRQPGYLIVGVDDDGTVGGLTVTGRTCTTERSRGRCCSRRRRRRSRRHSSVSLTPGDPKALNQL